ncbi:MAG TPA: hypothetical protein VGK94_06620 [Candidatus Polarisedimenticolia bacterium]|jgi:photosystem II stability/assembly factor-like uncharacterized protein
MKLKKRLGFWLAPLLPMVAIALALSLEGDFSPALTRESTRPTQSPPDTTKSTNRPSDSYADELLVRSDEKTSREAHPECGSVSSVDPRSELDIFGGVDELSMTPSGQLWLSTRAGHVYFASDLAGDWRESSLNLDAGELLSVRHSIDRISFFTDKVGFASGWISAEEYGPQDKVYRTSDGGASWQLVDFGEPEWIYDVFSNEGGQAWMGGSEGSFLYTDDFGKTWTRRGRPFKSMRTHVIYMQDSSVGVVGALGNGIKLTRNNGKSWKELATPLDQKKYAAADDDGSDHRITRIGIFKGRLFVRQDGQVFHSLLEPIEWNRCSNPGLIDFRVDQATQRLVGITEDRIVVELDERLDSHVLSAEPIKAWPTDIKLVKDNVYVLDTNRGIYEITAGGMRFSYPLTTVGPRKTVDVVRKYGDCLWGTTEHHVYMSKDLGETWCRVGQVAFSIREFVAKSREQIVLWDGHGNTALFDRRSAKVEKLVGLGDDDVIEIVQGRGVWVAFGGMQYETTYRIEVARTYFSGQFRGSKPRGFVYVSRDTGSTWTKIDEWEKGGVTRVFIAPEGDIYLLSYLGSVRRLSPRDGAYQPTDLILATAENRNSVPYVEQANAFYFADRNTGYIGGWIHHLGNWYFETEDGGRTWKRIEEARFPYMGLVHAGGSYLAFTPSTLVRLEGRTQVPFPSATRLVAEHGGGITDVSVDEDTRPLLEVSTTGPGGYRDTKKRWFVLEPQESQN